LQFHVNALLDREPGNAESWLERLEKIAPDQFATVSLRAELLFRRGKYQQTIDLLKEFVDRPAAQPPDRASRLRLAGERLEQFPRQIPGAEREVWGPRFVREAELLFRSYVDARPSQEILLVAFLARLGLIDDSLNVLERLWPGSNPVMIAQVTVPLLRAENISSEQIQRGEKVLQAALKKYDRAIPLLLVLADTYTTYERYDEAEPLYREILKKNETNPVALNNLAVLLAFQRVKLDEALRLVNRAMEISGPVGSMLDTRATVYLALGQPDKALADLKEALAEAAAPVRLFHQAQAYDQARDEEHALDALKKAQKAGLTAEMLQPPDRRAYKKLLKLLR
jgi:tetratricopeptide (TPR) repeat protein